jgi:hypothetical protein
VVWEGGAKKKTTRPGILIFINISGKFIINQGAPAKR